jgi:adenylosuccinate synthase
MKKRADVVIGANYGDEGKGHTVDALAFLNPGGYGLRINGGCQAGHTVTRNGIKHVFRQLSSASFHFYTTILTKDFIVEPLLLKKEMDCLRNVGVELASPIIDHRCLVTTPWHIAANRCNKTTLAHGSCGLGINETITSNEHFPFCIQDFTNTDMAISKLRALEQSYKNVYENEFELGLFKMPFEIEGTDKFSVEQYVKHVQSFLSEFELRIELYDLMTLNDGKYPIICEASQGLGLDQNIGEFPHVTRSNTGFRNLKELDLDLEYHINYTSRYYLTRHGEGPMDNCIGNFWKSDLDPTNVSNEYQGTMRYGILNANKLKNRIQQDSVDHVNVASRKLIVNCLDYFEDFKIDKFIYHDEVQELNPHTISSILNDIVFKNNY